MPARREAGFAMLLVFLLAACVAISLYMEVPRVVFEAQRNREQLLIDRGEQYKRAIQVYVRRYTRYPANLDALDNTDNRHFLRQHYKDPMTGKEEWRLIHAGPGGVFIDSLVNKPPGQEQKADTSTSTTASAEAAPSPWQQRRPSDVTMPSAQLQGGMSPPTMEPPQDMMPADVAPSPDGPQPAPGMVNQPAFLAGPVPTGPPGLSAPQPVQGQSYPTGQPMAVPGMQGPPGQPYVQQPTSIAAGQPAPPQPGSMPGPAGQNPALDMIRQMLTRPNPGGMAAVPTAPGAQPQMAGGIAGVASKLEAEGIKVYNDRTKYNEWEFLYDIRQDRSAVRIGQGQGTAKPVQGVPIGR